MNIMLILLAFCSVWAAEQKAPPPLPSRKAERDLIDNGNREAIKKLLLGCAYKKANDCGKNVIASSAWIGNVVSIPNENMLLYANKFGGQYQIYRARSQFEVFNFKIMCYFFRHESMDY